MQLLFFTYALFWASSDNLDQKHPASSCKQVACGAKLQGKPKSCKTLKVTKGPLAGGGFPSTENFLQPFNTILIPF